MKISIITPNYNGEQYLPQCIESVVAQTYPDWEMIVVDDCSTDGSREIIARYAEADPRIKPIYRERNAGVAASRNASIEAASGELIAFLDSDDLWDSGKLSAQVKCFQDYPSALVVYSNYRLINESGDVVKEQIQSPVLCNKHELLKSNRIGCLTAIYNAKKAGKHYFLPIGHEDYVFWLTLLKEDGYAVNQGGCLASHRIHDRSLSSNKRHAARWQWKVYRNILKMGYFESIGYFVQYAWNGLKKQ